MEAICASSSSNSSSPTDSSGWPLSRASRLSEENWDLITMAVEQGVAVVRGELGLDHVVVGAADHGVVDLQGAGLGAGGVLGGLVPGQQLHVDAELGQLLLDEGDDLTGAGLGQRLVEREQQR